MKPEMPDAWNFMNLKNAYICGDKPVDINITRKGKRLKVEIVRDGKTIMSRSVNNGKAFKVNI